MSESKRKRQREPLGITCKSTKCKEGLHCFLDAPRNRRQAQDASSATHTQQGNGSVPTEPKSRRCWKCGADLVDWNRVYKHNVQDAAYTFQCLKFETIRHHFWHIPIDQNAINHALRKGLIRMREAVEKRLHNAIGNGVKPEEPTFDGRQTPMEGNSIFYAQHATATCCRKCMEVWHNIPRDQDLTDAQIRYFADLIMLFIKERLPFLSDEGQKVPPIRKSINSLRTEEV